MEALRPAGLTTSQLKELEDGIPTSSTIRVVELPAPALVLDFRICVQLEPRISVGRGVWGQRNWISFKSGHWSAVWGRGTVKPGGQDSQLVTEDLATRVDTNYLLQTDDPDPAFIAVKTQGWRTGKRAVLEKLFDPILADDVKPSEYSFKLYVSLETGDKRYSFVNSRMWIGSGARMGAEVLYDAYRIV